MSISRGQAPLSKTDPGKALQTSSWDCEDPHGFKILNLSGGTMKVLHEFYGGRTTLSIIPFLFDIETS